MYRKFYMVFLLNTTEHVEWAVCKHVPSSPRAFDEAKKWYEPKVRRSGFHIHIETTEKQDGGHPDGILLPLIRRRR